MRREWLGLVLGTWAAGIVALVLWAVGLCSRGYTVDDLVRQFGGGPGLAASIVISCPLWATLICAASAALSNLLTRRERARSTYLLSDARVRRLVDLRERGITKEVRLAAALREMNATTGAGALTIVVPWSIPIPDVVDASTEPLIVRPQIGMPLAVMAATLGAAIMMLVMMILVAIAPVPKVLIPGVLLTNLLPSAFILLASHVWPRYLRFAPGMLQVFRYGLWNNKPRVESLPLAAGTTVFARHGASPFVRFQQLCVCLPDGRVRRFRFRLEPRRASVMWQILLSTAPTPPLDAEHLVG